MHRPPLAALALMLAGSSLLVADEPHALATPASKSLRALRAQRVPRIDGRLDDAVWQQAQFVGDFLQKEPIEGALPSRRTEIAILYDADALFIGARMYAAGPDDVQAVMTRRDATGSAETLTISLDTFRDRRTAYSFAITAAGVRADWYHPDDDESTRDFSYDPVWQAATSLGPDGWTAEARIPFTQLRFTRRGAQQWGINIHRYVPQYNEQIYWIPVPRNVTAWSSYFGELMIEELEPPLRVEISPYLVGDMTLASSSLADGDPFVDTLDYGGRAGVDVKVGLGPNLTLDATIYPDFGQVEADPAEVNLSAYESLLDERRPFFTEGSQLLQGLGPRYFYSRRIGAPPRGRFSADYVDVPLSTPILAAGKLTGRLPSGLSLGGLVALTQRTEVDTFDDASTPPNGRAVLEPWTTYGVLRVQQEIGASLVGTSLTTVVRAMDGDDPLAEQLVRRAHSGGVDWRLRRGAYEISGNAGFSHVAGEAAALTRLQQSSAHFFQRPDQDHVTLDPDRTSLTGTTGALGLSKRQGVWLWNVKSGFESPDLALNDAGRLGASDDIFATSGGSYRQTVPGTLFHSWETGLSAFQEWNFGGIRDPGELSVFGALTWKNFWSTRLEGAVLWPGNSDSATRGGPLLGVGWGGRGTLTMASAPSLRTQWNLESEVSIHQTGASGLIASGGFTWLPAERLSVSISPRYWHISDNRQYVSTVAGGNQATFDNRYVFATIDRRELAVQLRMQLAFSPSLAVDFYAEPFASSGRYDAFGELSAPRSRALTIYGRDAGTIERLDGSYTVTDENGSFSLVDPDFTVLSLRSTAVVRWEFLPGSTLFLVWQQDRSERRVRAEELTPVSFGDTVTSPGTHIFALKLSYWWPVD